MSASWKDLEGVSLSDKFELQQLLFEDGTGACFLTRMTAEERPPGRLHLVLAGGENEAAQLEHWQIAAGLSHPNLIQVWETGRTSRGVTPMLYLLTEAADESLAAVLRQRPLNQVEVREALLAAAKALAFLHSRALVHGSLEPAAILAVGDHIKLTTHTIAPAVEASDADLSAAGDLRALGACVHAMFAPGLEPDLDRLSAIPQPFRDIVRGCYAVNPSDRWTAQRIISALDLPAVTPPTAFQPRPILEWVPRPPATARRKLIPAWVFAPVAAGAVIAVLLPRAPRPANPPPAPPAANSKPAWLGSADRSAPLPAAQPVPPSHAAPSRIWRVISYTYSKAEDAGRMVRQINHKWPHLRAEEFSPNGSGPPYYVALGGRMNRNEALRLQQQAISAGLPADTFVRNFKK